MRFDFLAEVIFSIDFDQFDRQKTFKAKELPFLFPHGAHSLS